jgi:hypothetical protein
MASGSSSGGGSESATTAFARCAIVGLKLLLGHPAWTQRALALGDCAMPLNCTIAFHHYAGRYFEEDARREPGSWAGLLAA